MSCTSREFLSCLSRELAGLERNKERFPCFLLKMKLWGQPVPGGSLLVRALNDFELTRLQTSLLYRQPKPDIGSTKKEL